ncbi:nuclear transport factor 2 family protein [Bradyrhizobium symbiodeficiens]|uniref:Nuclear transport factor 2 family protein n=1 Tax=Bradyrhizobium symbiodeficiens TaxID=1404367 RepID=A0ABX5WGG6_9BRAD|nr:nuclear transport factor 2 family protein [Bradyrhizobium symbiodeficiens]
MTSGFGSLGGNQFGRQQVTNSSFDPMAVAVDWLDAYRAGDIEAILELHADDAVVHCGCSGVQTITGREALRAYWIQHLQKYPAGTLDDLNPSDRGTVISYVTSKGVMSANLAFDAAGRIKVLDCGRLH